MDWSVPAEKSSSKMLGLIISIAKISSKKIGALIWYLNKSTIRPCMEYCCHVGAGTPSCYLELLDKLQKHM